MATTYQVADGHDSEGSFADIDPQPKCEGIRVTRRTHNPDGTITDEAPYVEFIFNMIPDVTAYQSILTQFGLLAATTNEVTVKVRDQTFASVNKNGTAVQPEIGRDARWNNYFPRNIVVLVRDLAAT